MGIKTIFKTQNPTIILCFNGRFVSVGCLISGTPIRGDPNNES